MLSLMFFVPFDGLFWGYDSGMPSFTSWSYRQGGMVSAFMILQTFWSEVSIFLARSALVRPCRLSHSSNISCRVKSIMLFLQSIAFITLTDRAKQTLKNLPVTW